ncbi:hypothetical protein DL770_004579 [Monosporascus sp. CRB-9-2]|nr:hypothetical protein DL770_004579 [Monosporascus sp. CRB-9-2]
MDESTLSSSKTNRYDLLVAELPAALGEQILANSAVSERNQPPVPYLPSSPAERTRSQIPVRCSGLRQALLPPLRRYLRGTNSIRISTSERVSLCCRAPRLCCPCRRFLVLTLSSVAITIFRASLVAAHASPVAAYAVSALAGVGAAPTLSVAAPPPLPSRTPLLRLCPLALEHKPSYYYTPLLSPQTPPLTRGSRDFATSLSARRSKSRLISANRSRLPGSARRLENALASQCCRNNPSIAEEQQPGQDGTENGTPSGHQADDRNGNQQSAPLRLWARSHRHSTRTTGLPPTVESEDEEPPMSAKKRRRRSRSGTMVRKRYTYDVPEDCQDSDDGSETKKRGGIQ